MSRTDKDMTLNAIRKRRIAHGRYKLREIGLFEGEKSRFIEDVYVFIVDADDTVSNCFFEDFYGDLTSDIDSDEMTVMSFTAAKPTRDKEKDFDNLFLNKPDSYRIAINQLIMSHLDSKKQLMFRNFCNRSRSLFYRKMKIEECRAEDGVLRKESFEEGKDVRFFVVFFYSDLNESSSLYDAVYGASKVIIGGKVYVLECDGENDIQLFLGGRFDPKGGCPSSCSYCSPVPRLELKYGKRKDVRRDLRRMRKLITDTSDMDLIEDLEEDLLLS